MAFYALQPQIDAWLKARPALGRLQEYVAGLFSNLAGLDFGKEIGGIGKIAIDLKAAFEQIFPAASAAIYDLAAKIGQTLADAFKSIENWLRSSWLGRQFFAANPDPVASFRGVQAWHREHQKRVAAARLDYGIGDPMGGVTLTMPASSIQAVLGPGKRRNP